MNFQDPEHSKKQDHTQHRAETSMLLLLPILSPKPNLRPVIRMIPHKARRLRPAISTHDPKRRDPTTPMRLCILRVRSKMYAEDNSRTDPNIAVLCPSILVIVVPQSDVIDAEGMDSAIRTLRDVAFSYYRGDFDRVEGDVRGSRGTEWRDYAAAPFALVQGFWGDV